MRARRANSLVSFVMVDIDHFKNVNDCYGHSTGDQVIISLSNLLKDRLRKTDIIGRMGGEEFGIVLSDTPSSSAALILNEIKNSFAKIKFKFNQKIFSCS